MVRCHMVQNNFYKTHNHVLSCVCAILIVFFLVLACMPLVSMDYYEGLISLGLVMIDFYLHYLKLWWVS